MTVTVRATDDLAACHALRRAVFIDEQGIPEAEEWDDLDAAALHLLALDDGTPVGTARLLVAKGTGRIGRICVLSAHRGTGLGAALVREGIARLTADPRVRGIALSAQEYAIPFYERLGFVPRGHSYDDAGIPHRDMVLECAAP